MITNEDNQAFEQVISMEQNNSLVFGFVFLCVVFIEWKCHKQIH